MSGVDREEVGRSVQIVVFVLDGERYGLIAADVVEIARAVFQTPFRETSTYVEGLVNIRGSVHPVLDIRRRLGVRAKPPELSDHLILARRGARLVFIRVDSVERLVTIEQAAMVAPDAIGSPSRHVRGVAKLADGLILIHDLEAFLHADEEQELAAAAGAAKELMR